MRARPHARPTGRWSPVPRRGSPSRCGVPARRERHPLARRVAGVPHRGGPVPSHARGARRPRLRRTARPRPAARRQHGRVRAQPLPAGGALPPRAGRRVPGHVPRPVGAGLAAGAGVGRGARPRRGSAPPAVDLHRRAIGSSRSTGFATPTSRVLDDAAADIGALRPGGSPLRAITPQLPRRPGAAGVRQRPLPRDRVGASRSAGRVPVRRSRCIPDRGRWRWGGTTTSRSASSRPTDVRRCAEAVAAEIAQTGVGRAGERPAERRAPADQARRRRDSLPVPRQPPRVPGGAGCASHPLLRVQGAGVLRGGRSQGHRRARCDSWPSRRRTCGRRRSCARGWSACPTRACSASRPGSPRR